jgi:ribosomal protein S18 acetylase RimI-like enzyme
MLTIERRTAITQEGVNELNVLMRELHAEKNDVVEATLETVQRMLAEKNIVMVTVNDGEKIIGTATLYLMPKIGKLVSHLEDVVVSSVYRGQGLGEKLVQKTIDIAKELGVVSIALTSRPERIAANKLYQKLGFIRKETNPYTLRF